MPLRDHFRPPLDDVHSWDELHGMWPAMIVRELVEVLPEPYFAAPGVHLGTLYEIDVGTYRDPPPESSGADVGEGETAVATYAPPTPTLTLEPRLPNQDVYEVRIYDSRRNRRLVAAIEIVSPSNKDRPETRGTFVSKVAALLKHDICVSIVDVVSTSDFNLYAELMSFLESTDPALGDEPTAHVRGNRSHAIRRSSPHDGQLVSSARHRPTPADAPHLAQGNQRHLARTRIELRRDLPDSPNSLKQSNGLEPSSGSPYGWRRSPLPRPI